MTMTGLRTFDETLHATQTWLHEFESRLGLATRQQSYSLMRVALHTLRDALPPQETAHLSAQLPMLLRGLFYEGWRPTACPVRQHDMESFLAPVAAATPPDYDLTGETVMREVIAVMRLHVSEGEMQDVAACLPPVLRRLWEPA